MTEFPHGRTTEPRHVIPLTSVDPDELVQPPFKLERKYKPVYMVYIASSFMLRKTPNDV